MKKGPLWEAQIVGYLREHGYPDAERRVMGGARDRGDVAGMTQWTLELKNTKAAELGAALDEAEKEATSARTPFFALVKKRRGKGDPGEALAVLPFRLLVELARLARTAT